MRFLGVPEADQLDKRVQTHSHIETPHRTEGCWCRWDRCALALMSLPMLMGLLVPMRLLMMVELLMLM